MAATQIHKLILPPALGSWAWIFKPREGKKPTDKPKYSICLIWPKSQKELIKPLAEAVVAAAVKKFGDATKPPADERARIVALLKAGKLKSPLRDGDLERPTDKNFKGCMFANASTERTPGIVDKSAQPVFEESEAYSGCTFRASVAVFAYDRDGGKGVALGLNNLQVVSKGPRLDGRKPPEDEFAPYAEQGDAPEPDGNVKQPRGNAEDADGNRNDNSDLLG